MMSAVREQVYINEPQRSTKPGNKEHAQNESRVTNTVHDEGLIGRIARRLAMKIKSNQQIRAQSDALPAHEHQHVIVGEDQREHGEHEQVEIPEETVIPSFMRHVSGGINMYEHPDAGNKQQPDAGERIEQKSCVRLERRLCTIMRNVSQMTGVGA